MKITIPRTIFTILIPIAATLASVAEPATGPGSGQPTAILSTLQKGHPRLLLTPESLKTLKDQVSKDPERQKLLAGVCAQADRMIKDKPVEYVLIGPRLLDKSRTCLNRVSTLSFAWLMTNDRKYADRALQELETVAAFPDWHPPHFLDTAEMTCACAIGYDWLYSYMNSKQRDMVRAAIISKGLKPGLDLYRSHKGFTNSKHNWSQVCNGGLAVGALAIADEEPAMCAETLESGLKAVQNAMANFGPDGSWNEGPGYWGYTTQYTAYYLEAMRTALGNMHGLDKTPGLAECGLFKIYFSGPTGIQFNFADAGEKEGPPPQMFWLANTFNKPVYAWEARRKLDSRNPLSIIWYSPAGQDPEISKLPLNKFFRRDNIVFLRSAWQNPDAMWVGFKGGDNKANHSHLDLGSFVFDALGTRWVTDLGSDDYNLPGYFGKARFTYFRLSTESHSTLVIDNTNQATKAEASVIAFADEGAVGGSAVADLSPAYPMTKSALRGISLRNGKCLLVEDEVLSGKPVDVRWGIITRANVTIAGADAVLEQKGKRMYARILEPAGAAFEKLSANPPPPQRQQSDATKLGVKLPARTTDLRLVVTFATDRESLQQQVKPLKNWPGQIK